MYWDAEKSTYLPAPTQTGEAPQTGEAGEAAASENADLNKDKKEKKEKEKVKVAKKIAKVSVLVFLRCPLLPAWCLCRMSREKDWLCPWVCLKLVLC